MKKNELITSKLGMILGLTALSLMSFSVPINKKNVFTESIVITLNVDTGQIDKQDVNASCNFGQPSDISNEEFTVTAGIGDVITWQGVSSSSPSTDVVNITAINHEGGKNVFGENVLKGNGENPEKVIATVLYNTPEREEYKYKISFTVTNNGVKRNGTFHIDPKILVH